MISLENRGGQAPHSTPTQIVAFIDTRGREIETELFHNGPKQLSRRETSNDRQREVKKGVDCTISER